MSTIKADNNTPLQNDAIELEKIRLQMEQNKNVGILIDKGLPILERYLSQKVEKVEAPKIKLMFWIFGFVLFVSVITTGILTFYGKVNSESFTFLLGTLLGSIVALIGDVVIGTEG